MDRYDCIHIALCVATFALGVWYDLGFWQIVSFLVLVTLAVVVGAFEGMKYNPDFDKIRAFIESIKGD